MHRRDIMRERGIAQWKCDNGVALRRIKSSGGTHALSPREKKRERREEGRERGGLWKRTKTNFLKDEFPIVSAEESIPSREMPRGMI